MLPAIEPSDINNRPKVISFSEFSGETFAPREACENQLSHFFHRDEDFYKIDIMQVSSKQQQGVEQNSA